MAPFYEKFKVTLKYEFLLISAESHQSICERCNGNEKAYSWYPKVGLTSEREQLKYKCIPCNGDTSFVTEERV